MIRRVALAAPFAMLAVALSAAGPGCANDGYGIDACRQIEAERCRWVVACNIGVGVRRDNESSPVDDCVRFYRDECLHGMTYLTQDPSDTDVGKCTTAIHNATSCDIVRHPENDPACSWLKPSADAGEASTETSTDASGQ